MRIAWERVAPAFVVLVACEAPPDEGALHVQLSEEIGTVATVSWHSEADDAFLEFAGEDGDWSRVAAEAQADGSWKAMCVGLRQGGDYTLRAGGTLDGSELTYAEQTLTAGSAPPELPVLSVVQDEVLNDPGFLAIGVVGDISWGTLVDADGNAVWWYQNPLEDRLSLRLVPSRDGRSVLVGIQRSASPASNSGLSIHRVAWDGTVIERIETPLHHHDFLELPSGELAWLSDDPREINGTLVHGDTLVVRADDDSRREVWNAWDHFAWDDYSPISDFVHANSLQFDEESGELWMGLRNADQLLRIDPETGEVRSRLFGTDSDLALVSGQAPDGQHNFTLLADGLLLHDNRPDEASRIVEYRIDPSAGEVEQVWEYRADEGYDGAGLGDALRLSSGETIAVWGSSGVIDRVDADGTVNARFAAPLGSPLGYGVWVSELQPLPPAP